MLKKLWLGVILFFIAMECVGLSASEIFTVSNAPPPGFAIVAKAQKILVDLMYQGKYIGTYPAIVSPTTIRFLEPENFLNKIPRLRNRVLLTKELEKKLATNSNAVCQNPNSVKVCGELHPAIVGVIYAPNTFVATLFIGDKYIVKPKYNPYQLLPTSTSGWSYSNSISTLFSGSNNQNSAFNLEENTNQVPTLNPTVNPENLGDQPANYTSFTTNSVLADGNNRGNLSASFNNPLAGGDQLLLNQADVERDHGKHSYAAGLIQTEGSQFFPNIAILGAQYATTLNTMPNELNASASPLIVFINLPSQVSIFKDGQLIYSKYLPGGYQRINTASFPEGAYQLTVKSVDSQGNTSTRQYYYVKTDQLPPLGLPQYSITAGDEVSTPQFDTSNSTQLLNIPVYQYNYTRRFDNTFGMGVNSIGNNQNAYVAAGPIWVYGPILFSEGLLGGTQDSLGTSTNASYTLNKFGASINYLQLFTHNRDNEFNNDNDLNYYYDRLLTFNNSQVDGTIDYAITPTTLFNIIGTYNDTPGTASNYSYGASLNKTLFQYSTNQLGLSVAASRSNTDYTVMVSLVFSFNAPTVNASLQTGYLYQNNLGNVNANLNNSGLQTGGNINWFDTNNDQYGSNVGLHGSTSPSSENVGTTYQNTNKYSVISGYANYNNTDGYGGTEQYGGEFASQLNWTPEATTISNGQLSQDTGVIVYVKSPEPNSSFLVNTNEHPAFSIQGNKAYFIPLAPYQEYDLQISNNSNSLYNFNVPDNFVTLYPGNIQTLKWNAIRQNILIGRLMSPKGTVMANADITGAIGNAYSNDQGYFQINASSMTPVLYARYKNSRCELKLPHIHSNRDYVFLGEVTCVPTQNSPAT